MKKAKLLMVIMAITILVSVLTGCSRNGNSGSGNASYIGASKPADNTVSAVLTNNQYSTGIPMNWRSRVGDSDITMSGLQQIAFIIDGDETIKVWGSTKNLSSIKLEFTGQTSGKKVSLDTSLVGKVSNLGADNDYFQVDGYTFKFYPHYFTVGENVTIKATFTYGDIWDAKTAEGYITFTVGEDTGETFEGTFDALWDKIGGDNGNTSDPTGTGDDSSNTDPGNDDDSDTETAVEYIPITYHVDGLEGDFIVYQYEEESKKNVVEVPASTATFTFFTRADANRNITKMYIVPKGYENTLEKLAWTNEWYADNCHMYENLDMSQFAGQTITIRVEFLEGAEWNPLKDHYYGFITVKIPS